MNMEERLLGTFIVGVIGIFLTIARRYSNKDSDAGLGVAAWTLVVIVLIWLKT